MKGKLGRKINFSCGVSGADIENYIISCLESKDKCCGQEYNEAITMSGIYLGVQARI